MLLPDTSITAAAVAGALQFLLGHPPRPGYYFYPYKMLLDFAGLGAVVSPPAATGSAAVAAFLGSRAGIPACIGCGAGEGEVWKYPNARSCGCHF